MTIQVNLKQPVILEEVDSEILVVAGCALGFVAPRQPPHVLHVDDGTEMSSYGVKGDDLLVLVDGRDTRTMVHKEVADALRSAKEVVFERPKLLVAGAAEEDLAAVGDVRTAGLDSGVAGFPPMAIATREPPAAVSADGQSRYSKEGSKQIPASAPAWRVTPRCCDHDADRGWRPQSRPGSVGACRARRWRSRRHTPGRSGGWTAARAVIWRAARRSAGQPTIAGDGSAAELGDAAAAHRAAHALDGRRPAAVGRHTTAWIWPTASAVALSPTSVGLAGSAGASPSAAGWRRGWQRPRVERRAQRTRA